MESHRTRMGQRVFPQRSFAPRHWMHRPLAIAAFVSASKIASNWEGAGCTGRESIAGRPTWSRLSEPDDRVRESKRGKDYPCRRGFRGREGGLAARPDNGGSHPPVLLRFPEHGGAVRLAAGAHAESDRVRGGHPAKAPVEVPR